MFTSLVLVTTMLLAQGAAPSPNASSSTITRPSGCATASPSTPTSTGPSREGRFPAIVVRTPYGVQREATGVHDRLISLARMGYAVVNVDVRGRYESEGTWDPFRAEAKDGYDVVEWAAKQPWSNGKVATQGGSYLGHVQWATLGEQPPSLVAAFPAVASTNLYANWVTQGGAFHLAFNFGWARRADAVPDHAAAVVLHRSRRRARAALRAAAHAPAARDDGRAGVSAPGEALARLGDARQLRRLLEGGQRRGEIREGQRAGHDAGRLVRHLPARHDRRLRRRAQARRQRAGAVADAHGDWPVGPRPDRASTATSTSGPTPTARSSSTRRAGTTST